MKKVLIVSYHFPPDSEVGGLRAQKYAKYLELYGWMPIVLSVDDKYYPVKDYERIKDVHCPVSRTSVWPGIQDCYRKMKIVCSRVLPGEKSEASPESLLQIQDRKISGLKNWILNFMFLPDDRTGWIFPALFRGIKLVRHHHIDTIMTTSPPHSVQLIGLFLKKILRKRWVIDFRDPWFLLQKVKPGPFLGIHKWLEEVTVRNADMVITATEVVRKDLLESYPDIEQEKIVCIPNGYDLDDFRRERKKTGYFVMSYIGEFYLGRSPELYLRAVSDLIREERIDINQIRLRFIGKVQFIKERKLQDVLAEQNLAGISEIQEIVPYAKAIDYMLSSDVLIVISPQHSVQPMKAFEYMVSGAHIIAFTPPGALADLINNYPKGVVVGLDDYENAREAILSCYNDYLNDRSSGNHGALDPETELPDTILEYERRNLTRRLSQYL